MPSSPTSSFGASRTQRSPPSEQQTMRILGALDRFITRMRAASNSSQSSGRSVLSEFGQDQGSSGSECMDSEEEELTDDIHGNGYAEDEDSCRNADRLSMDLEEDALEEDFEDSDADDQLMDTDEDEKGSESDWHESGPEYNEVGYTAPEPALASAFHGQLAQSPEDCVDDVRTADDFDQPRIFRQAVLEEVQGEGSGHSSQPPLKVIRDRLMGLGGEYSAACLAFKVAYTFQVPAERNRYISVRAVVIEDPSYSQGIRVLKSSSNERSVGCEISAYLRISQERAKLDKLGYAFLMECEATYVADNRWCLLMPLAVCDLRDFLPRLGGKGEARALMAQIVLALATIHSIGVTHGDIKPENVMIDRSGNIKLMDFGSSYVRPMAAPLERSTVHPSVVFTPAYGAPERRAGTSPATDYWSLGCLFYELAMRTASERPQALADNVLFELIDIKRWVEGYRNGDNIRSHLPRDSEVLDSDSVSLLSGLLCPDPGFRFTIDDMLNHAYFANIDRSDRDRTMSEFQRLHRDLSRGEVNSFSDRQAKYLDTAAQNVVARQQILIQTDRYNLRFKQ